MTEHTFQLQRPKGDGGMSERDDMARCLAALLAENEGLRAALRAASAMTAAAAGLDCGDDGLSDAARNAHILANRVLGGEHVGDVSSPA